MFYIMQDSKKHIIKIAFKLFLQKSYKSVTLRNIIAESGLSNGTFYHYFNTKEQLYEEVANYYWCELMNPPFNSPDDCTLYQFIQEALRRARKIFISIINETDLDDEHTNFYSFISEANRLIPGFKEKVCSSHKKGLEVWTTIIEKAKHSGEIRSKLNSEDIAQLFFTISWGTTMSELVYMESTISQTIDLKLNKMLLQWEHLYGLLKV